MSSVPDVSGVKQSQETMIQMLAKMMERLDKLESARATHPSRRSFCLHQADSTGTKDSVTCLKCGMQEAAPPLVLFAIPTSKPSSFDAEQMSRET